jgi:hypothetical protein
LARLFLQILLAFLFEAFQLKCKILFQCLTDLDQYLFITNYEHFSNCFIFFQAEDESFLFETCAQLLQKQLLTNDIKISNLHIHYAFGATSKFNFEPLFKFYNFYKEYRKHSIQNSLKKYAFSFFLHFIAIRGD